LIEIILAKIKQNRKKERGRLRPPICSEANANGQSWFSELIAEIFQPYPFELIDLSL
jgi:hypothetical protein